MTQKSLRDINFTVKNGVLNCIFKNLTSLEGCPTLKSVTKLNCNRNILTSLEGCPTLKSD